MRDNYLLQDSHEVIVKSQRHQCKQHDHANLLTDPYDGPVPGMLVHTGSVTVPVTLTRTGAVTGNGFQTTTFTMGWSAQGSCNEDPNQLGQCGNSATASWSASISATGQEVGTVPEPGTLALAGLALLGLAAGRRVRG